MAHLPAICGRERCAWGIDSSDSHKRDVLKIAQKHDPDLIVMGSSGHSRLSQLFFGDFTEDVLRHTKVPVWMHS